MGTSAETRSLLELAKVNMGKEVIIFVLAIAVLLFSATALLSKSNWNEIICTWTIGLFLSVLYWVLGSEVLALIQAIVSTVFVLTLWLSGYRVGLMSILPGLGQLSGIVLGFFLVLLISVYIYRGSA